MELTLALIVFALLIVAWFVLPGSAVAVAIEEAPAWPGGESLQIAPAEA